MKPMLLNNPTVVKYSIQEIWFLTYDFCWRQQILTIKFIFNEIYIQHMMSDRNIKAQSERS